MCDFAGSLTNENSTLVLHSSLSSLLPKSKIQETHAITLQQVSALAMVPESDTSLQTRGYVGLDVIAFDSGDN